MGSLFVGAFVNAIMVGSVRALWQAVIQPEMQGRLFSVGGSLVTIVKPIGLAIAGPVADFIDVQFWFLLVDYSPSFSEFSLFLYRSS
jgi:DHA3 family macrolide efflux protein-like MFS transporter